MPFRFEITKGGALPLMGFDVVPRQDTAAHSDASAMAALYDELLKRFPDEDGWVVRALERPWSTDKSVHPRVRSSLSATGMGIFIELDSDEIYPEDPGQGTPAMVRSPANDQFDEDYCATFNYALNEGCLIGHDGERWLTRREIDWLNSKEDEVNDFIERHTPRRQPERRNAGDSQG